MSSEQKVIVSERALIRRINRKLYLDDVEVCTSKGSRMKQRRGRYYVFDLRRNLIVSANIDIEQYARELGVMKPWEALAE